MHSLDEHYLSERNITNDINEIEAYIAPAQEREWARWNEIRNQQDSYALKPYRDAEGYKINREISEYDQDVFKLKTILRKHGNEIPKSLQALEKVATKETDWTSRTNLILLFVMALFCIPIIYVSRE